MKKRRIVGAVATEASSRVVSARDEGMRPPIHNLHALQYLVAHKRIKNTHFYVWRFSDFNRFCQMLGTQLYEALTGRWAALLWLHFKVRAE